MNIPGVRFKIPDEVEARKATYKVKDLVAFLESLDQESDIVWAGKRKQELIFVRPTTNGTHTLFICEAS